jgi:2C-methyl-D-erythritol 2,4-cyclodiphosphate synthase
MRVEASCVAVKATSPAALGAMGRREGIAAQAVALLEATT